MLKEYFTTFNTQIGVCGIRWNNCAITGLLLPENSVEILIRKLKINPHCYFVKTYPYWAGEIIKKIKLHLDGKIQDFSSVPTDTKHLSLFTNLIYEEVKKIPAGNVISYKRLTELVKRPKASRAAGSALGKNPILLIIPCHRIINTSGKLGGFSASGGVDTKLKLLEIEGAIIK